MMQPEKSTTDPSETRRPKPSPWLQWTSLGLALTITALIVVFRGRVVRFASYGYLGLFVVSIVGNATVLLPLPSLLTTLVVGGVLNPWWVGLVSGVGMTIGEISGYLAGYGGTAIINTDRREVFRHLARWMQRRGFLTLVVLAVVPNPLFDLAGVAAGMTRFPFWKFLLAALIGKTIKGLLFAFAGAGALPWLEQWIR
jgi:membrane protein YqaA with SNARE-associated domain